MKSARGKGGSKGAQPGEPVTPLEERVLRMHHGVTTAPHARLEDASGGKAALGHSLCGIEAEVLKRAAAPKAVAPPHLRLVDPDAG